MNHALHTAELFGLWGRNAQAFLQQPTRRGALAMLLFITERSARCVDVDF